MRNQSEISPGDISQHSDLRQENQVQVLRDFLIPEDEN